MVVDKCIGRCLDVGSTPTGSIKAFHSLVKFSKTLLYQRFLFFLFCLLEKHKKRPKLGLFLWKYDWTVIEYLVYFSKDS